VLVHADHGDAVEPAGVVDQHTLALGQDRVVGGVPRDAEAFSDACDGQVLAHDAFQRPPQPTSRQLRPRLRRAAGVLAPHMPAPGAAVATDRDHERRRPPAQRLVRQLAGHRVTPHALATAAAVPLIGLDDPARQHGPIRFESLAGDFKAELIEAGERVQVRAGEGNVVHVEVFRMGSVRTSILGRPRRLPRHRHVGRRHPQLRRASLPGAPGRSVRAGSSRPEPQWLPGLVLVCDLVTPELDVVERAFHALGRHPPRVGGVRREALGPRQSRTDSVLRQAGEGACLADRAALLEDDRGIAASIASVRFSDACGEGGALRRASPDRPG